MNTRKNYSRLLLALLLLVAGLAGAMRPHSVAAQNSGTTGPLNWNYDPGTKTLSITGSGDMPDFAIFMNQPWGAFREQIETVTIGAGVTSVGKNAFLGCTALTAVTLPSSVTTIGAFAFVSCKALTGITIPSGVKTIKESVFFGCTALTGVTLPDGLQTIGASAFLGCSLTNVTLPNSVTTMGEAAFHNCVSLTNVTLSDKLTTIEERVFNGCSQLKNVTIPNSVTTIGNGAFAQCTALKNVNVFWDTPLTISADAFSGIELNKVKLYVPAGKKGAYQAANVWKGFDVQEIPGGNLSGGLHWQYIPSSHTLSITGAGDMPDFNVPINQPWGAFRGQIENVTIGAGVTSVGENAFASCKKLTAVTLPSSVTTIGVYAFPNCKALTGITIPSGVKTIKESAFYGCTALTNVTLPEGLTTIEEGVFTDCDALASIELPASLQTIDASALDAGGLTEIKVQTGNTHFEAAEGVLYNKGKTALLRYPRKKPGTTFTVPASVTTIGEYAFAVSALTDVTLPDGLQTIGEGAFGGCTALKSVTLPAGLKEIEKNAFGGCETLTSINLPEGLKTIGEGAFNECTALKSITIPKKVETIGDNAFQRCTGLKDVTVFWNTPLTIPPGVFDGITPPTSVTLHVPAGTGEAYQGNAVWGELTIEELPWGDFDTGLHWAYDAATHSLTITNPTPDSPQPMPNFADQDNQPWKAYRDEIQKVTIGAGVSAVGECAFTSFGSLTSINLPEGLEKIGNSAFGECEKLASITLPSTVKTIEINAFMDCKALPNVTIPGSVTMIGVGAFTNCFALTSVTLPDDAQLTTIGKIAFYGCEKLASITIPKSVTTIGQQAFAYCAALKSITIPNGVTAIADGVFASCAALKSVTLPDGLQTIGKNAFQDCAALASISIPNSVTTIGSEAFSKCSALKDVTVFWETPISTYADVFNHLTLEEIRLHVPEGKIGAYKAANVFWHYFIVMSDRGDLAGGLKWQMDATYTLTIINPTPGSPKPMPDFANRDEQPWESFRSEIQAVTIEDGVSSVGETAFSGCTEIKSVTLPKSVTTIREGAFAGCNKMTHVTLPADAKLDTIGKDAFIRCTALTSISLPKSTTTIEDRAFSNCEALTSVTLPADGKLQTIGVNAFGGCVKLKSITIPNSVTKIESGAFSSCKELTSVTLPDNAQFTKIESGAFQYCKALERITIPSHVTTIEVNAFNGCTALASATLPKSVTTIGASAFQDCKALKDMTVAWTDTASIPKITLYVFQYTPPATVKLSGIRLHVPHGTVAAYQSKDVWKEFTIVEQPLPPTPTPPTPTPTPTPKPQLPDRPSAGTKIGGLTLSATNFTLNGERTFRFTVTIAPAHAADKRLSVSSSDETVVRVRILPTEETRRGLRAAPDPAVVTIEGTVCGLGKAKIHVKSTDGSNLTATCYVDVRALPTANIEAPATRLYTAAGHLHLTLPTATAVNVYNLTGTLVRTFIAPAGTSSIALSQGVYVVRAGTHTEKVFVD